MTEPTEKPVQKAPQKTAVKKDDKLEVTLKKDARHGGKDLEKGTKIKVKPAQAKRMKKAGVI